MRNKISGPGPEYAEVMDEFHRNNPQLSPHEELAQVTKLLWEKRNTQDWWGWTVLTKKPLSRSGGTVQAQNWFAMMVREGLFSPTVHPVEGYETYAMNINEARWNRLSESKGWEGADSKHSDFIPGLKCGAILGVFTGFLLCFLVSAMLGLIG